MSNHQDDPYQNNTLHHNAAVRWVFFVMGFVFVGLGILGWLCRACQRRCLFCWQAIHGQKARCVFMAGSCVIKFLARCLPIGKNAVPCPVLPNTWRGAWWGCLVYFCFIDCLPTSCGWRCWQVQFVWRLGFGWQDCPMHDKMVYYLSYKHH